MEKEKRRRPEVKFYLLSNSVKPGPNGMRKEKLEGGRPHELSLGHRTLRKYLVTCPTAFEARGKGAVAGWDVQR